MSVTPPPPSADWAYFLDVDGTLVELAPTPDGIRVDARMLDLLVQAYRLCGGALALVSGRTLADLDARLGLKHLPASGQHGLEWRDAAGAGGHHSAADDIRAIAPHVRALQHRHRQLIVEDKGMSIALHYRAAPRLGGHLHRSIRALVRSSNRHVEIQAGKRVVEIKPKGWDKGKAIESFMARPPFAGRRPVFIGDDLTDEHGFEVINRMDGVSIKVGSGSTSARYRLPDVNAVLAWLRSIELTMRR